MNKAIDIISASGVAFGTSGARGLVTQFTPEVCAAFSLAFVEVMKRTFEFDTIALAIDNRPSSLAMAQSCAAALMQVGVEPLYYGVLPTPALAYQSMQDKIPAIMITGSHIPFDRNGLKFYRPDGEISKDDELSINSAEAQVRLPLALTELVVDETASFNYQQRYTSLFKSDALKGKTIAIYEHSSAGRDIYCKVFEALGAETISLGRANDFVPIDTEAVCKEDVDRALAWSKQHNFDAIFSTDGDGDRPLVADELGQWLTGDELCLLCSQLLNIEALAVPVSCNTAIDKSGKFQRVQRTKIGSPYVIAEFSELAKGYGRVAGFEANGGFLLASDILVNEQLLKALPTRDALLPGLMVIAENTISEQVKRLPQRYTSSNRIKEFAREKSLKIIESIKLDVNKFLQNVGIPQQAQNIDETDGLRITLDNLEIVHLRPSGNAPELRCYAESGSKEKSDALVENILSQLPSLTG